MPDSKAVVTVQGATVVLPHIAKVTAIQKTAVGGFAWAPVFRVGPEHWFTFPNRGDAEQSRTEFVEALVAYWSDQTRLTIGVDSSKAQA